MMIKHFQILSLFNPQQSFRAAVLCLSAAACGVAQANPLTFGLFTYEVEEDTWVNIVDYPTSAVGPVVIPQTIEGRPVRNISSEAFSGCSLITSVTIPEGVTFIGGDAFTGCVSLTSALFPNTLEIIEPFAFFDCNLLSKVTIPENVFSIGNRAFDECDLLSEANFLGNAPADLGEEIFGSNASMTVNFFSGKTGFTTPRWRAKPGFIGYQTFARTSLQMWLILNGLPANEDLAGDSDGDGVSLLMAYALNLDPRLNLSASLPKPVFTPSQMSMTFYAGRTDVTYSVVASDNLGSWSASGVNVTPLSPENTRTATVAVSGPQRFMRLVVTR